MILLFRNIFERATALNLASKKMKFLFKRYAAYEQQYGDESTLAQVRQKASEYMDQQMFEEEKT